jgi:hypothetical protein
MTYARTPREGRLSPGLLDWISADGCDNVDRATANARLFGSPGDVLEI